MPALNDVLAGSLAQAVQVQQIVDALKGTPSKGVPIALVSLNDSSNYALTVQNDDPTNSRALSVLKADGTSLITADATGVTLGSVVAGSIPGAAIADGGITSAKIADGTIATADLAAGATYQVLLALGSTSGPSTTSTTPVDMPDMSVTGTFNGGQVVAFLVTQASQSALGNGVGLTFNYDGSGSGRLYSYTTGVAGQVMVLNIQESVGALSGSHTIKGQYQAVGGGTATLSGAIRNLFVIEFKR